MLAKMIRDYRLPSEIVIIILLMFLPIFSIRSALSVEQVVKKLDQNFESIKTYQANFEQEIRSQQFGRSLTKGSGQVFYSKPGKMVWHYTAPEEHWYITDGKLLWDYLPSAKQVMELKLDQALSSNLPKSFLFGMTKISEQFNADFASGWENAKDRNYHLVLTPKKEEDQILLGTIELLVDAKSFLVQEARLRDSLGNENVLKFSGIKVNPKIDEKMFSFKIPPDVEKITPGKSKD